MDLDTVAKILHAFYRLVGTTSDDLGLEEQGEDTNEVAYLALTRGSRKAQRFMLKMGYGGWRSRSSALVWSGSDDATGGRYATLPTDFLRAAGNQRESALRQANGDTWGQEVDARDESKRGNGYYFRGTQVWLTRLANVPDTLYLEYHYQHPAWSVGLLDAAIDFPLEARALIIAEGASVAKEENWLPGGPELETKIDKALMQAREEARDIARQSRQPRQFMKPRRFGNHWTILLALTSFVAALGA